ncbi:MAG: threonine synthase [Anaerolineae bacterium]|nr:threonine synthase [Anaerolineae bacterium]MDW8171429.1 threonine synthase [Anaerolineae bacterium]
MSKSMFLQCVICGRQYGLSEVTYTCPDCGEAGTLDILYDYAALRASVDRDAIGHSSLMNVWRYKALLPIADESPVPSLSVGWTPLYNAPRVAESLGLRQVWLKDDGRNPTASYKDRASVVVVTRAMELGIRTVSAASTGNAAAALAGVMASVPHMQTIIFVPATAPEAKIAQLLVYGAQVILIEDSYDVAFDLCMQISLEANWYCRNTGVNPFTTEGKKSASLEIAEQLGWRVPDVVVVSVGDGSIISGLYKGFWDLYQLGWTDRMPRIIGVQAEGSSALVQAWRLGIAGQDMQPAPAETIADSISAGLPRDRVKALRAVRQTNGAYVAVSDEQILAAIPQLARLSGVFAEPASAAAFAGAQIAVESGYIHSEERVLLMLTGNGLKDIKRAQQAVSGGLRVPPDLAIIRQALLNKIETP